MAMSTLVGLSLHLLSRHCDGVPSHPCLHVDCPIPVGTSNNIKKEFSGQQSGLYHKQALDITIPCHPEHGTVQSRGTSLLAATGGARVHPTPNADETVTTGGHATPTETVHVQLK